MPPFAILDFPSSGLRLFAHPREVLVAEQLAHVRGVLDAVDLASSHGHHAVGFVSYDAAPAFDSALVARGGGTLPLAWFGVFDRPLAIEESVLPHAHTSRQWTSDVARHEYDAAIAEIREGIGRGDYYQVNHTFPLRASNIDPLALWQRLRRAQPGAYCAYLDLGPHVIVSASPELFFARQGNHVLTRPMKGTAQRGRWLEEDDAHAAALSSSEKERAENVMIVDLVRNDLGRVAEIGSVRVTRLCEVERWPTVLQMTSTVEAKLRDGVSTFELFSALFPCGSVTGAPKFAATRAIAALERSPRGIYCGAIGHVEGDRATFSVAIRTAMVDGEAAEYGVGGGITWDSEAGAEFGEALAKSRVLTADVTEFQLIETMRLEDGKYVRLERHLARLARSAAYFSFPDPTEAARSALDASARDGLWRARLLAGANGSVRVELGEMPGALAQPVLASHPVSTSDPFLFHKTTHRSYEPLLLFWNERGELTEFTIGNLVVEIDGQKWTPPVSAGLLAGVFREELLEQGVIRERLLRKEDLPRAQRTWLINSLREWVEVTGKLGD